MSSTTTDALKVAFKGRARWGSPFVARVFGRPGQAGYDPNGRKKMTLTLLVPKTDTRAVTAINAAIEAAVAEHFGSKRPAQLRRPVADGDERLPSGEYRYAGDEFRDRMLVQVSATENRMPVVMKGPAGQQSQAQPSEYSPGYWLTVVGRTYAYDVGPNKGISIGCNAVNITATDTVFVGTEPIADLDEALAEADGAGDSGPKAPSTAADPAAQFA